MINYTNEENKIWIQRIKINVPFFEIKGFIFQGQVT